MLPILLFMLLREVSGSPVTKPPLPLGEVGRRPGEGIRSMVSISQECSKPMKLIGLLTVIPARLACPRAGGGRESSAVKIKILGSAGGLLSHR